MSHESHDSFVESSGRRSLVGSPSLSSVELSAGSTATAPQLDHSLRLAGSAMEFNSLHSDLFDAVPELRAEGRGRYAGDEHAGHSDHEHGGHGHGRQGGRRGEESSAGDGDDSSKLDKEVSDFMDSLKHCLHKPGGNGGETPPADGGGTGGESPAGGETTPGSETTPPTGGGETPPENSGGTGGDGQATPPADGGGETTPPAGGPSDSTTQQIMNMITFAPNTDPQVVADVKAAVASLPPALADALIADHPEIRINPGAPAGEFDPNTNVVTLQTDGRLDKDFFVHEVAHVWDEVNQVTGAFGGGQQWQSLAEQAFSRTNPADLNLAVGMVDPPFVAGVGTGDVMAEMVSYLTGNDQTGSGQTLAQAYPELADYLWQRLGIGSAATV